MIGDRKHRGGASTLTMQLATLIFLADTGTIKYKVTRSSSPFTWSTASPRSRSSKMYANQINLGQRGSFSIDGFGEASQAYFGKDVQPARSG